MDSSTYKYTYHCWHSNLSRTKARIHPIHTSLIHISQSNDITPITSSTGLSMSYVHCQHTSADTASCRCPVWEAPEDNHDQPAKLCDTCGHRAEWHQVDSAEEGEEENCKSSWPNGQPCTCPTWVPFEDPTKNSGCALCGHKKGWHRPTIVSNHLLYPQNQLLVVDANLILAFFLFFRPGLLQPRELLPKCNPTLPLRQKS